MKTKTSTIGLCSISIGHENIDRSPTENGLCIVARMEMPIHHAVKHRALLNDLEGFIVHVGLEDWQFRDLPEWLDHNAFDEKQVCSYVFLCSDITDITGRDLVWEKHSAMLVKAVEVMLAESQVSIMIVESR